MEVAIKEFEEANNGRLPTSANNALALLIRFAEVAEHFDHGEKILLAQLKHPIHAEQKNWLTQRLNDLYLRALQNKGAVSLGTGSTLYKALERKLLADMVGANQNHRYRLLELLCTVYRSADVSQVGGG